MKNVKMKNELLIAEIALNAINRELSIHEGWKERIVDRKVEVKKRIEDLKEIIEAINTKGGEG